MRPFLLAAVLLLGVGEARAWGRHAHRLVNELAIGMLPAGPLRSALEADEGQVIRASTEPDDVFRDHYPREGERHYFNIDALAPAPFEGLPVSDAAIAACPLRPPKLAGRLPVAVRESYDELVRYLRAGDDLSTRRAAGLLGHYVADATMPLHATTNFDGWDTGNRGIHFLLEVTFYGWDRRRIEKGVRRRAGKALPSPPRDPEMLSLELLREGIAHVPALLETDRRAKEKGGGLDGRSVKVLRKGATEIVVAQVARAAEALAALWLAAELESRPGSSSR